MKGIGPSAAVVLALLAVTSGSAQTIGGLVVDARTGNAIKGAKVSSPQAKGQFISTSSGKFVLELRPDAAKQQRIAVRIEKEGYEVVDELVENPQTIPLRLPLNPVPVQPKSREVPYTKPAQSAPTRPKPLVSRGSTAVFEQELQSSDASRREAALSSLRSMGAEALPAVPAIATALQDDKDEVRVLAAKVLGELHPTSRVARDALLLAINRKSESRCRALWQERSQPWATRRRPMRR